MCVSVSVCVTPALIHIFVVLYVCVVSVHTFSVCECVCERTILCSDQRGYFVL